eukprot:jgi/Astpho2/972/Aster-00803
MSVEGVLLPVILPRNTALEALLACQPAECELCGEEVERALLGGHTDHDCEERQVSCEGTGRGPHCPRQGTPSAMPEGRCPVCQIAVVEQLIATAQAELRELEEKRWQAKGMLSPEPSACSTQNLADSEGDYASG